MKLDQLTLPYLLPFQSRLGINAFIMTNSITQSTQSVALLIQPPNKRSIPFSPRDALNSNVSASVSAYQPGFTRSPSFEQTLSNVDSIGEDDFQSSRCMTDQKGNHGQNRAKVDNTPSPEDFPYSSAIQALRAYHSIHGNLVIPRRYIIPVGSNGYPKEWHSVDLASTVYNMKWWQRHVRSNQTRVAELNQIGFIWERLQPEWNLVVEALITYNALYGNLLVPVSFVVPHDGSKWPRATWGIQLGRCVRGIRARQDFVRRKPDRVAQLIAMEFVWDLGEYNFRKCLRAIEYYAKLEEDDGGKALRIPNTFVIPSGHDSGWPEDLWSYPLGAKCCAIRQKGLFVKNEPERIAALEEIGFQWYEPG